jgi:hypothetical protein
VLIWEVYLANHTLLEETALSFGLGDPSTGESSAEAALAEMRARGREMGKCRGDRRCNGSRDGDRRQRFSETGQRAHGG